MDGTELSKKMKSTQEQLKQLEGVVGESELTIEGSKLLTVEGSYKHDLKIPACWEFSELKNIIEIVGGSQPPKSEFHSEPSDELIRLIQIRDYKSSKHVVYIPKEKARRFVRKTEIMIGRYGPPIFQILRGLDGAYNVALMKAIPVQECMTNEYLFYYLSGRDIYNYVESASDRTAGQSGVNKAHLEKYPVGLPPLAEQTVIAQTLDTLLAQVDNIKTRLDAIPKILKTFRQSVLAAAVSGKLTKEWRGKKERDIPVNYKEVCSSERKNYSNKKVKKLVGIEVIPEIELPKSWIWQSLDESSLRITDGTHFSPKSTSFGDFMYVTSKNVRAGYIDLSKISYVDEATHREIYQRCDVKKGDVLYVKDGANTGLACVNTIEEEISLLSSVGVFKVCSFVNPKYLEHYLNSPTGRKLMLGMMGGTAIPRLTLTKLAKAPFSLPPMIEQTEIVRRVEELFAFADKIEQQVKKAQGRVNNLTQSILAKAFRGELTEQWRAENPDLISGDNSAEALLAKIQEERDALKQKAKPKKTVKKKVTSKKTD